MEKSGRTYLEFVRSVKAELDEMVMSGKISESECDRALSELDDGGSVEYEKKV